ncbi:uncharacterized protein LOC115879015 [Sitophilus oryzae]|uniref:Uncharacterized protein LOC115879015 n=1 Tax=Sitophilus oryzae TaxID=7048 RepID=A0A6J2XK69_SITOR|nr:uncharacterized protein LOC115879015 [Sitophilus oryzae]
MAECFCPGGPSSASGQYANATQRNAQASYNDSGFEDYSGGQSFNQAFIDPTGYDEQHGAAGAVPYESADEMDENNNPAYYSRYAHADDSNYQDMLTEDCPPECPSYSGMHGASGYEADESYQSPGPGHRGGARTTSNTSMCDGEELNRTTAPRSTKVDVRKARISQSLETYLNTIDEEEKGCYMQFVETLQNERRQSRF